MDKCREAFERHYLSLPFHTEWSAQICLDACSFDVKQDAYLPKMDWISSKDADKCVIYCCMLNTAYLSFKEQQKRIDELQKSANEMDEYITTAQRCLPYYLLDQESDENWIGGVQNEIVRLEQKNDELRAEIRKLIEEYKSEEKELELKEWEQSTIYGRIAIELEEALKGGEV
ncbi:hypothetical protein [Acinetobacter soli]|uniref:hypothetical protein n=1 Tax=Acinetobacter soli TaxID=487316 RepID=UPI001250CF09|nr:hypothetical protein [Acinetobacter soli]